MGVAVGADQPKVLAAVVRGIAVDVVEHEHERLVVPLLGDAADRAAAVLLTQEVSPDVVTPVAPNDDFARTQPR